MSGDIYRFSDKSSYRFDYSGQGLSIAVTSGADVFVVPTIPNSPDQHWIAVEVQSSHAFRFKNAHTEAFLEKRPDGNKLYAKSKGEGPNQFIEARATTVGNWALFLYKGNEAWSIEVKSDGPTKWLELSETPAHAHFDIIALDSKY